MLTAIEQYAATVKNLATALAKKQNTPQQYAEAVFAAQEPCRVEAVASEITRTSGRSKNQAAGMAAGMSPEALSRIGRVMADRGDVAAAIDAELNAVADAAIARQAKPTPETPAEDSPATE